MDIGKLIALHSPLLFHVLHPYLSGGNDTSEKSGNGRDAKAMAVTPTDVKELPNSYVFTLDMPGVKSSEINVQVEDDKVLKISGERKREEEKEGVKFVRNERRMGKFTRKFVLPENANVVKTSAVCQDGELRVTVEKLPKKSKNVEVKIG